MSHVAPEVSSRSPQPTTHPAAVDLSRLDARTLFGGRRGLLIEHDGALYRLRITQHNRLILTK